MADARARIHRTLGVCCATSGGGMMNLAVGLAESHAEGVPVLAIIGQSPTSGEGRGAFQDSSGIGRLLDAVGLFKAITKYVARLDAPERFWEQLHAAVTAALTGRPGPVVLLVPRDLNEREVPPMPPWCPRTLEAIAAPPTLKVDHGRRRAGADRLSRPSPRRRLLRPARSGRCWRPSRRPSVRCSSWAQGCLARSTRRPSWSWRGPHGPRSSRP